MIAESKSHMEVQHLRRIIWNTTFTLAKKRSEEMTLNQCVLMSNTQRRSSGRHEYRPMYMRKKWE